MHFHSYTIMEELTIERDHRTIRTSKQNDFSKKMPPTARFFLAVFYYSIFTISFVHDNFIDI